MNRIPSARSLFCFGAIVLLIFQIVVPSLCSETNREVFSFGYNFYGQLGDGTNISSNIPVAVSTSGVLNGKTITSIAAGGQHSLVLSSTGQVFSFGNNQDGQLGDGTWTRNKNIPVAVSTSGVLSGKNITAIAAGGSHSLVLSSTGQVFSFGDNGWGQLGDGTNTNSNSLAAVSTSGVLSGKNITAIAAGWGHSLVLSSTGQVFSFGYNGYCQLGDGTNISSNIPVAVSTSGVLNGKTITAIAAGQHHSLVLSSTGQVFSFGYNDYGQLGDGTYSSSNIPVAVSTSGVLNGKTIAAIAAGGLHSLVLSSTGQVFSFGNNKYDQLGDGTNTSSPTPVAISLGTTIHAISAGGYHSLVSSSTGQVFSFGWNKYGQLGDGTNTDKNVPVAVSTSGALNGKTITAIAAGDDHSLVLSSTGQVFSFGYNNYGQLGDGANIIRNTPVAVSTSGVLNGKNITAIDAGFSISLVLSSTGQVFSFGSNGYGQLGDGTNTSSNIPVAVYNGGVLNGKTITVIAAGGSHSLVLSSTGQVFSFGSNGYGQLGDGTNTGSNTPVAVSTSGVLNGKNITAIAAGYAHSLVLSSTGQVFSFGYNDYGQLGDGTNTGSNTPVAVYNGGDLNGKTITAIASGYWYSLVLSSTGQVFSFGDNYHGQLGDGTNTQRNTPVAVSRSGALYGTTITAIAAGGSHSLVLSSTGEVFSFGDNIYGQLGDGTNTNRFTPVAVSKWGSLNGNLITAIAAGSYHSLVLSSTGEVFSFGWNSEGELGDGTWTWRNTPVAVSTSGVLNGATITAISAGGDHSLVLGIPLYQVGNVTFDSPFPYLYVGQSDVSISWNGPGNVTIELIRDWSATIDEIVSNWGGGSPFTWSSVSASDARRSDFRLRIKSTTYPSVSPTTSDLFEIDMERKNALVDTPASLLVGQSDFPISWTPKGFLGNITIELIRDGSATIDEIVSNWGGGSPFIWNFVLASDAPRSDFRFRINSTTYPSVSATSDPFEIIPPSDGVNSFLVGFFGIVTVLIIVALIMAIIITIIIFVIFLIKKRQSQRVKLEKMWLEAGKDAVSAKVQFEYNALEIKTSELTVLERLGKGSFGTVFKASYKKSNVAVKMLEDVESEGMAEFLKEAITMAPLQHPRLLQFVGVVNDEGKFGIVTEFMDRGSLDKFLWRKKAEKLSWTAKMGILDDVAAGMTFIHSRGFIHRDLKSPNILIGESNRAKIGDFGMARAVDKSSGTMTDKQGTPFWMAPEVIESTGHYDNKCDVFSFGIIMWEVMNEKEPYHDVQNKQGVMFNVVKDPNFRPAIPSVETVMKLHSNDEKKQLISGSFEPFVSLMKECWSHGSSSRPTFEQVVERLHEICKPF